MVGAACSSKNLYHIKFYKFIEESADLGVRLKSLTLKSRSKVSWVLHPLDLLLSVILHATCLKIIFSGNS